jgi:hypothetical protein
MHRLPVWQSKLVARAGNASGGTVVRDGEGQWHGDAPSVTLAPLQSRQGDGLEAAPNYPTKIHPIAELLNYLRGDS